MSLVPLFGRGSPGLLEPRELFKQQDTFPFKIFRTEKQTNFIIVNVQNGNLWVG